MEKVSMELDDVQVIESFVALIKQKLLPDIKSLIDSSFGNVKVVIDNSLKNVGTTIDEKIEKVSSESSLKYQDDQGKIAERIAALEKGAIALAEANKILSEKNIELIAKNDAITQSVILLVTSFNGVSEAFKKIELEKAQSKS